MSELAISAAPATRYDPVSILLHWLVALLVVVQFALGELWDFFPRPVHHLMVVTHMSFGVILTAVLLCRLVWRFVLGHEVEDFTTGLIRFASRSMHYLLYALLIIQAALGFFWPWTESHSLIFFGLAIPSPFGAFSKATNDTVSELHDINAWVIIVLAGGHAAAALAHHFILRDRVLSLMLPARWDRG